MEIRRREPMKIIKRLQAILVLTVALLCSGIIFAGAQDVQAASSAGQVEVSVVNYDALEMTVKPNGNAVVYFSTNKSTWNELEYYTTSSGNIQADISWISANSETTLYLKGNINTKITEVTIPKQNTTLKVTFDKVDGLITLMNTEEAESFQWRKSTDYSWHTVSLDEGSSSFQGFLKEIEQFRVKGAKLIIRTAQIPGTSADDPGVRPSKEITVSITKRGNAPSVTVNIKTLKLNTTEKMEYSLDGGKNWKDCRKTMTLESLLPDTLYQGGKSEDGSVMFRKTATTSAPYSKTFTLNVPAQKAAPGSTIKYYTQDGKYLYLQFSDASASLMYEYTIIKPGKEFDPATASWKTVKKDTLIKIGKNTAPENSKVYFRYKGVAASVSKGISLQLPSAYASFTVTYN